MKGADVSLRAQIPAVPGLAIEAGHRSYTDSTPNENFLKLTYNVADLFRTKSPEPWLSDNAYNLSSMDSHKYDKVRRENLIVKQRKAGSFTFAVKGF